VGNTWQFEYDLRDLRTATIKPDGTRIEFTYDSRSRLVSYGAVGDATSVRSFTYDEEDNLVSAIAAAGTDREIAHTFTYDERDQLSQAALAAGPLGGAFSFDYEYDALQRRSVMRDSAGGVTRYTYDRANRLVSIEVPSGRIVDITYDDASRRSNVAMPNGLNARATFSTPAGNGETTGLLASIEHGLTNNGATGSALNQLLGTFSYDYNSKANITGITETVQEAGSGGAAIGNARVARQRNYTLDTIERLTNVADGSGVAIESYELDEEGNRITSHLASFHVTNPANRVTEDEFFQFESDVNGNLVRKTEKATGETWVYEYSVYDELTSATRQTTLDPATAQESIVYVFDAMGRRHTERKLDATTGDTLIGGANFRYDGQHLAHEQTLDTAGTVSDVRWYSHSDITDDLVSLTPSAGDTGTVSSSTTATGPLAPAADAFYYHTDHQGSVRAITDEAGNVVNEYAYDSYGNVEIAVEAVLQRFRYTARFFDADTGLYYYRARHYDAGTGRFNQEDPLHFGAGDLNVYRYVSNNPINWTDPTGMSKAETAALSSISLAILYSIPPAALLATYTSDFNLNARGRAYYLQIAGDKLDKISSGVASFGDFLAAAAFDAISATIHQANTPDAGSPPATTPGIGHNDGPPFNDDKNNKNKEKCASLLKKMQSLRKSIIRRDLDLKKDVLKLAKHGKGLKLRETIQGHRTLIRKDWNNLRNTEDEYYNRGCK